MSTAKKKLDSLKKEVASIKKETAFSANTIDTLVTIAKQARSLKTAVASDTKREVDRIIKHSTHLKDGMLRGAVRINHIAAFVKEAKEILQQVGTELKKQEEVAKEQEDLSDPIVRFVKSAAYKSKDYDESDKEERERELKERELLDRLNAEQKALLKRNSAKLRKLPKKDQVPYYGIYRAPVVVIGYVDRDMLDERGIEFDAMEEYTILQNQLMIIVNNDYAKDTGKSNLEVADHFRKVISTKTGTEYDFVHEEGRGFNKARGFTFFWIAPDTLLNYMRSRAKLTVNDWGIAA